MDVAETASNNRPGELLFRNFVNVKSEKQAFSWFPSAIPCADLSPRIGTRRD
jgi:hypothetical protein